MKSSSITLILLAGLACQAGAQNVYKCAKDGQASYSETPCTGGQLQIIEVPPPPAAVDKGAATRQQRVASQLEAARKKREHLEDQARERAAAQAARQAETHDKHCTQLRLEQKWAQQDAASAGDKQREAAQRKAGRAADKLAAACPH